MIEGNDLFGKTIRCSCGRTHQITPNHVDYEEDAISRMPGTLSGLNSGRRLAVIMDARTRAAAGKGIVERFKANDWQVHETLVPDSADGASPVCDDGTKEKLESEIPEQDVLIPVGGGVITDLGKWIAFDRGIPFVAFATAASMNGYASANVAPTLKGIKSLIRARPPEAIFSRPSVLGDAPWELTASGLGDIIAKSVSSADWFLNHFLFGDFFCERSVGLIADVEPLYFDHPEALNAGDKGAIRALFMGLLLTGVSMTMAESSAPSSGGEHMVSHTLDMMSDMDGIPHDLHGRQVGIGTILASELYRRVLDTDSPDWKAPLESTDISFWGHLSGNIQEQYGLKQERLRKAREVLSRGNQWDELRSRIRPMLRAPGDVKGCLQRAGAAYRAEDIGCNKERILAAFRHAHEIRSRFTVLDLAHLFGIMPRAAEEIVEEWV
ncbi:MAG: iron-containing alcohol dehydrogenase [Deltaproteobacteria bacterium]|nr:iron-containing alcohol dehydrogenase [Deltaproteobacteria bacterium]